ncbi:MAG: hypothetical protein ACK58T_50375, partial [Phycisphaerae bacterium]
IEPGLAAILAFGGALAMLLVPVALGQQDGDRARSCWRAAAVAIRRAAGYTRCIRAIGAVG